MRLAIKDGSSVAEIVEKYSAFEVALWAAYERLNGPITLHERLDILFARSDQLFAEANRDRKKSKKPYKLKDFLITWYVPRKAKKKEKSPEEVAADLFSKAKQIFGIED